MADGGTVDNVLTDVDSKQTTVQNVDINEMFETIVMHQRNANCGNSLYEQAVNNIVEPYSKLDWNNLPLVILSNVFNYLSSTDRLNASSTCSSWRNAIFNSTLWPQKHLKVNLCPYKFTISNQYDDTIDKESGFHLFKLHEPVIRKHHFGVFWEPKRNKYQTKLNRKNFNQHLKTFIQKCSRFLTGIDFYFDPNSSHNVMDLIKILKYLSSNEVANYEVNNRSNVYAICRNLKHFEIIPITTLVRCSTDDRFMSLYYGLADAIRFLFSKCQSLQYVSIGNLHELVYDTEEYFKQFIHAGYASQLRCLQFSSIKGDVYRYLPHSVSMKYLEKFISLQHLSIDFDVLNTKAISILSKLNSFQTLSINVHRFNREHPGISKEVWSYLVSKHPNLEVSVNLLHTDCSNLEIVIESLINTSMRLKHFRAYYLEFEANHNPELICNMIEIISNRHSNTLTSLILVDSVLSPVEYFKILTPNVLVMLSWRCHKLQNIALIGK